MTSGQQLDLTTDLMSLEQWRLVAEAKSGAFFSLACRSGAQLALDDPSKIKGYSDFGFHLGLMLQVHDDFEDLQTLVAVEEINFPINLQRSLAVAYAMDVLPESDITRLERRIQSFYYEPETVEDVIEILDNCGAGLYMIAELERHNNMAITSLAAVNPSSPAGEKLLELLSKLSLA
jgi:geranylgeranyl pyrophosphate synthase